MNLLNKGNETIQVVELGDALRAMGKGLQEWVDAGMPQEDPEVVGIPFDVPVGQVIELTERCRDSHIADAKAPMGWRAPAQFHLRYCAPLGCS